MAELLRKLEELRRLPSDLHWFCELFDGTHKEENPRSSLNHQNYQVKDEAADWQRVEYRRKLVTDCLQLFGYDGDDVVPHQSFLNQQIDRQLGKCDACIVQYYKAKHQAMESLKGDYEEEEVAALAKIFDDRDIDRIKRGLDNAAQVLRAAPPSKRGKDILETPSQLSLFEALSCQAFLENTDLVDQYLDEPLGLIQSNKRLILAHVIPAATIFLFGSSRSRCIWAMQAWGKYPYPITKSDFDFAVRSPLLQNLRKASEPITDYGFLQRFWYGVRQIIDKLDSDLITHSLRAMEVDLFRIALEHLQYSTAGLKYLMQTTQKLLEVAPNDFWDSMGAISPITVIEQVFNNPYYDKFMEDAEEEKDFDTSTLKDMLSWIKPFLESLQTGHQAQACRSLAFQLMDRLQSERFPRCARIECYRTGLSVLSWTLGNCNGEDTLLKPVGRIAAAETLKVTSIYIRRVAMIPTMSSDDGESTALKEPCIKVVKIALALECKSLRIDQETLRQNKEIQPGFGTYSQIIWDAIVDCLDRGSISIARAALTGITDLTGLEKFKVDGAESYAKEKSEFNVTFRHLTHLVCEMLERINDFNPVDLDELFRQSDTATALVSALFSPDASTYEAGVNLIKSISSESARKEAIGHLLLPFFATTLNSFSWSIRRIARNRSFASCPRMLKTCTDLVDVLCDSRNGLLRTRVLNGVSELKALENFWEQQWYALKVIYEMTEEWGKMKLSDSSTMKEFCRDTMQFSDHFFDQYSIFASAMDSAVLIKEENQTIEKKDFVAGRKLLEHPAKTMDAMVKWLRLRDVYLASTAVMLTRKVLDRLSEWNVQVAERPNQFLEQVILNGPQGRTHLTPQEKAELARALEANVGHSILNRIGDTRSQLTSDQKQTGRLGKIDLAAWRSKAKPSQNAIVIPEDDEFGDSDVADQIIMSLHGPLDSLKEQESSRASSLDPISSHSSKTSAILKPGFKIMRGVKNESQLRNDQAIFREKREKEKEAKKKRDAEQIAAVRKKMASKGSAASVIGEGSALSSIGLKGKDHTPKISSIMVSSESESDSEDEFDHELFGGKVAKVSDAVKDYQDSRRKQVAEQRPIKKTRQIRSAKDMRARLTPDLTSLHKTILGWDFFQEGDFPPGSDRQDYSLVTNVFRRALDYQNIFEPLLILEAWQGFLKSREEGSFKTFEILIANRLTVDSFVEVSTTMPMAEGKDIGVSEADIVLISKAQSPTTEPNQPHCFGRVHKISRKKASMDIAYRVNTGNSLLTSMVPNATLYGVKIQSMTPLEREYGALLGLQYFDLCDEIIKAKPSPLLNYTEKQLGPLMVNYSINNAQAKAVRSAVDNDAFTLIQGPPGSGKTKTIVAIVGALLTGDFADKGLAIPRPQPSDVRQASLSTKKMLVCAPSNAAVDELVMRFKEGIITTDGQFHKLSVVRLGRTDAINANVLDVTLEELVNAKMNVATDKKTSSGEETQKIMMAHKATCDELNNLRAKLDELKANGKPAAPEYERQFDLLKRRKQQLSNQIDSARDSGDMAARDIEISRRRVQQEIIDSAQVLCATLSGSGHEMFQNLNIEFETVIIDEAAQSIELSALIPLKYGCSKCILVGDPKQLPPTVLSREAARFQYEQSLFVRMQANHPDDVHLLDTQYRMHPEISSFPSLVFYDGKLLDGENMAKARAKPWHHSPLLGPYRFFDVQGTHQSAPRGHSLINLAEIEVALTLFDRLTSKYKHYNFKGKVGIITPYKSQLRELRSRFARVYGDSIFAIIEFNTTDAFQGRESEVIIFSCVRASGSGGIGFLSDIRRMNVGITRAKSSLWVLGNSQSLRKGEFWDRMIQNAKSRDCYSDGEAIGMLKKLDLNIDIKKEGPYNQSTTLSDPVRSRQDIEMPDVSSAGHLPPDTSSKLQGPQSPVDQVMSDAPISGEKANNPLPKNARRISKDISHIPSGGLNGLNSNANCGFCGTNMHQTYACDNQTARNLSQERCYRCGDPNHQKQHCTLERCIECGNFGHLAATCRSTKTLPKQSREEIRRLEYEHKVALKKFPENQRKKQLGDHARTVPIVRTTSKTPPPIVEANSSSSYRENMQSKRKRTSSTSMELSHDLNASARAKFIRKGSKDYDELKSAPKGPAANRIPPLQLPADKGTGKNGTSLPQTAVALNQVKEKESHRKPAPLIQPDQTTHNGVRPPIKKKKEANPFIMPKNRGQKR